MVICPTEEKSVRGWNCVRAVCGPSIFSKLRRSAVLFAATILGLVCLTGGAGAAQLDHAVKARFLVNFTLYTYWPRSAFFDRQAPVNICLYGRDPFGRVLDRLAGAHQYVADEDQRRSLNVWRTETVSELTDCHVVFVSGEEITPALMGDITAPHRLIVGDSGDLTRNGGHIRVYRGDDGMQFEVNLNAVNRAQLQLSSQLLRLASVVSSAEEEEQ